TLSTIDLRLGRVCLARTDITETLKEERRSKALLEEALKTAEQANRAKSEFLSNVSHDIRTPMNAIVGMTAIAMSNLEKPQQLKNCLSKIVLSSNHLLGLINNVLDMSKIESGKLTLNMDLVSLREMMEGIIATILPQMKTKGQEFDVILKNVEAEEFYSDGIRLHQVLLNLLGNAIKFTPEGGKIQLCLFEEPSEKGTRYVRLHLLVKDNGMGMTEEFQEHIFDSFAREDNLRVHKTEGSGLGMAITKYIIDALDGTIEVKSHVNEGTEFHVTLDVERAVEREMNMVLPRWNMLLVDDDQALCESATASLQEIGLNAEWANGGKKAVAMVKERHKKNNDYQMVLLDWKMPEMNGIETARAIQESVGKNIPILVISAYDWSDIEEEARAAGIVGFIPKPLFKSTLFLHLRKYMEGADVLAEEKNPDLEGMHILLAEDNLLNQEIAVTLLSERGALVDAVENGQLCVEKMVDSPVGYYDAILMDIRMPVMNGYEAARQIRNLERADANLPIIAMTADAFA
ncbi:MAG: response regulator, partial [Anaerotignum sp.]